MAAIIFDLDGTLVDSFDYVADFLAKQAGCYPLSQRQKSELRGRSMIGMARHMGFHWWHGFWLLSKGRRDMRDVIKRLDTFAGMPEVVRKLQAEGHELFILSTNSVRNIHNFLQAHKLREYFLAAYGGAGMFGKASSLRRLLKEQNLDIESAVYVGDEVRDVEAAQSLKLPVVAVSWGFADRAQLKSHKPTALVDTPAELLKILQEL